MQCVPHCFKDTFTDPFISVLVLVAALFSISALWELSTDLSYSKFIELVKSPKANSIQSIEAKPGLRDILGGHTLFVQLSSERNLKSVFVKDRDLNEVSKAIRKSNLQICFVCGNSLPFFKAVPHFLLLIATLILFRLGQTRKHCV